MKKIYMIAAMTALVGNVCAQSNLPQNGPVKFADVVAEYERTHNATGTAEVSEEEGGPTKEGDNYHFERWEWYWQQHLDADGYMVPPAVNYQIAMEQKRSRAKTTADQSDWKFQGPTTSASGYNGIGRINIIEFHPTDVNTYWVGASGGGVWKTTNDGQNWTLVTGDLPRLDVSDIDVNPQNPNTIYLCTGDRDGGSATYNNNYSIGVLKSYDGGTNWVQTGVTMTTSQYDLTNCLVISPSDTNILLLATNTNIRKSTDGGANWVSVQSGHFKQIVYHPTNANIVYASRYNGDREIYRSTDGGSSWTEVTSFGNSSRRIALAVTPANPSIVRAAVCNSSNGLLGIYESVNSGASFTQIYAPTGSSCNSNNANYKDGDLISSNLNGRGCGRQGWYDLSLVISPTNANVMFFGAVNTYGSTDGGKSWSIENQWTSGGLGAQVVHADKHWFAYSPLSGHLFECNDGGVYKTVNPLSSIWNDLTYGMGITQFYRNAVSNTASYVLAGSQDNGTKGLQGGVWDELTGGDGMECQIDPVDPNVFYTGVQYGVIRRTVNGGNSYTRISKNIPDDADGDGSWITPYLITPQNNSHLVAGYEHIYFSPDRGNNWSSISGNKIIDINNEEFLCTRLALTNAANPTLYAIFPDSQVVFYADNYVAGQSATFDTINVPYNGYISDIKAHPTDSGRFYLTFSAYTNVQVAEYNKGTWTKLDAGLPNIPVRCFEYDTAYNVMYIGTDIGVYYMDTSTNNMWATFNKGLPSIEVTDLCINYSTETIWAATYGRGLWSSLQQGANPDTGNSVAVIPYAENIFNIAPNPNSGSFKVIAGASVNTAKAIRLNVIDYTGKTVLRKDAAFAGSKQTMVDASALPAGVYIVELSDETAILGRKRVVIR